jgi:hypothetical protein
MQTHFELIPHIVEREIIQQRVRDGYINATAMCKAAGKLWTDYRRLKSTGEYLDALSADMGIPITELIQSVAGGNPQLQGTWAHPQVATHLAQWLSPEFAVQVNKWVFDWLSGKSTPGSANLPYHLQRYLINNDQVPSGYFSILAELSIMLIAPLENAGYRLPPELVPDISSGQLFCKWLREAKGVDTDSLPVYFHRYPDGRVVPAKLYPEDLLADFRRHVREFWIPKHAVEYFRPRDSSALQYLPKLISNAEPPKAPPKGFGGGRFRKRSA